MWIAMNENEKYTCVGTGQSEKLARLNAWSAYRTRLSGTQTRHEFDKSTNAMEIESDKKYLLWVD
jgi:tRNA(Ile2) C34 agmatinyltransferase TiaS